LGVRIEEAKMPKTAVIAVGGNSLIIDEAHQTVPDQYRAAVETMKHIAGMIERGFEVIITHGNGPQVGYVLLRSDYAREIMHPVPLDSCIADTQGAIGYNFQMAFGNELGKRGIEKSVATIVTQVVVDKNDPAFKKPTKPIGPFYSIEEARKREASEGWHVMEDAGRGWRRVLPSPVPMEIVEIDVIRKLIDNGVVVIAVGGGGIPVIRDEKGKYQGVSAVIDKDHASALLASKLNVDLFVISTSVEKVFLNFGQANEMPLDKITVEQAKRYIREGHFKPGSMLPKIEAVISYLENGGKEALITTHNHLEDALDGKTGTRILP
jgi:carbamate kinase